MGARTKRILALTLSGLLIMADETVAEASTIALFEDNGSLNVSTAVGTLDSGGTGRGNFAETTGEMQAWDVQTDAAENPIDETGETGSTAEESSNGAGEPGSAAEETSNEIGEPGSAAEETNSASEVQQEEKIEITTNEDGQTVYRLLADVDEGLKIDMAEGETVIVEGNGNTIQAKDNGIYATGNGTLVIENVIILGGDSTSGIGVLDKEVNITLSGTVAIEELYFGGNTLTLAEGADVTLYGRGAQVQSLFYAGNSFEEEENATLTLVQGGYGSCKKLVAAKHISVAYGNNIASVNYVTDQENIPAEVVLPALTVENYTFSGWYMDGNYSEEYSTETAVADGMVLYAKYVDGRGNAEPIESEPETGTTTEESVETSEPETETTTAAEIEATTGESVETLEPETGETTDNRTVASETGTTVSAETLEPAIGETTDNRTVASESETRVTSNDSMGNPESETGATASAENPEPETGAITDERAGTVGETETVTGGDIAVITEAGISGQLSATLSETDESMSETEIPAQELSGSKPLLTNTGESAPLEELTALEAPEEISK
jgi:hypothetical protein